MGFSWDFHGIFIAPETIGVFLWLMMLIYMLQIGSSELYPFFAQLPRFGEISHDLLVSESFKNSEFIHK
jgi:hypothetical protein